MTVVADTVLGSAAVLAAEAGPNPLVPHLSELIVGLVSFAVLFWLVAKYIVPMFERTYEARADAIEGGIRRAEQAQAEANRLLEQYRAQLAEARTEAAKIREDARAQGQQILEELRAQGQAEQQRIVQQGREQLAADRQQLIAELRADIGRVSVDLAGRIIGASLTDDARRASTVDRFLTELESTSAGTGASGRNGAR
jgi:F-type H+-transporting ATPase subunit b